MSEIIKNEKGKALKCYICNVFIQHQSGITGKELYRQLEKHYVDVHQTTVSQFRSKSMSFPL